MLQLVRRLKCLKTFYLNSFYIRKNYIVYNQSLCNYMQLVVVCNWIGYACNYKIDIGLVMLATTKLILYNILAIQLCVQLTCN